VTLAIGGFALERVLAHASTSEPFVVAMLEWTATFAFMILTYDAILVGSVVCIWLVNAIDVAVPFLSAMAEFSMFSVLTGIPWDNGDFAALKHLRYWFLATGIFGILSGFLVGNAHYNVMRGFAPELGPAIRAYKNGLVVDFVSAVLITGAGGAVFFFIAGQHRKLLIHGERWAAAAAIVLGITGFVSQERARRKLWRAARA
jgi:hypothetical protein